MQMNPPSTRYPNPCGKNARTLAFNLRRSHPHVKNTRALDFNIRAARMIEDDSFEEMVY